LQESNRKDRAKSTYAFAQKQVKPKQLSGPGIVDITLNEVINIIRIHKRGNFFKFSWLNEVEKQSFLSNFLWMIIPSEEKV
jgi:hypothetical protein